MSKALPITRDTHVNSRKHLMKGLTFSEVKQLYESGLTTSKIASMLECTQQNVTAFLRKNKFNLYRVRNRRSEYYQVIENLKSKILIETIVKKLHVKRQYVQWVAYKNGLKIVYKSRHDKRLDDEKWLSDQYFEKGLSQEKIAQKLGCTIVTVDRYFKKFKIPKKQNGDYKRSNYQFHPLLRDKKYFITQLKLGKTLKQISHQIGCCQNAVCKAKAKLIGRSQNAI